MQIAKAFSGIIITCAIIFIACKKENTQTSSMIQGRWELARAFGGGGYTDTTYPSGNGNIIEFHSSRFAWRVPGESVKQGTFKLTKDSVYYSNTPGSPAEIYDRLHLYSTDSTQHQIYLNRDTLILDYTSSNYDGVERVYVRKGWW